MNEDLLASTGHCRQVARQAASSFAWAFWLLPADERRAMEALYAFARHSDDLADQPGSLDEKRLALVRWRSGLEQALAGSPTGLVYPALAQAVKSHQIPPQHLREILTGVEMDLDHAGFATFADLAHYCRHVASAIGLACLPIWGCRDERATRPAIDCGIAFQLTNILRDLAEDAALGRSYLPRDEVARLGGATIELVHFQCARAAALYDSSAETERYLRGASRRLFRLMHATYRALLAKIERDPASVFARRQRVSRPHKAWLAVRTLVSR